jgi:transcription elongation factor GreB
VGRWRPPAETSTALITRAGFERLRAELDDLWRVQRPEVVRALAAAAAEGDRSENAEYTYRKKQLGGIDRRVRYLSKRLESLKVVEGAPADREAVFFGAEVELEDVEDGSLQRLRIVGPDETDAKLGWISIDSPLARALLRKRIDDSVIAELPGGRVERVVVAVRYSADGKGSSSEAAASSSADGAAASSAPMPRPA